MAVGRTLTAALLVFLLLPAARSTSARGSQRVRRRGIVPSRGISRDRAVRPGVYFSPDRQFQVRLTIGEGKAASLILTKTGSTVALRKFQGVDDYMWLPHRGHELVYATCNIYSEAAVIALWDGRHARRLLGGPRSSRDECFCIRGARRDGRVLFYSHASEDPRTQKPATRNRNWLRQMDRRLRLRLPAAQPLRLLAEIPLAPNDSPSGVTRLEFSPDGRLRVSKSDRVLLWDSKTGARTEEHGPALTAGETLLGESRGAHLRATRAGGALRVRVTGSGVDLLTITGPTAATCERAIFSPIGDRVALADESNRIDLWDLRLKRRLWSLDPLIYSLGSTALSVQFSPARDLVVIAWSGAPPEPRGDEICGVDAQSGRVRWRRYGHSGQPAVVSPDQRHLASSGEYVALRSPGDGRILRRMEQHGDHMTWWLTFGAGGRVLIASGSQGGPDEEKPELRAWDVSSGRLLWRMRFEGTGEVAVSPDGRKLAAEVDNSVCVWELR